MCNKDYLVETGHKKSIWYHFVTIGGTNREKLSQHFHHFQIESLIEISCYNFLR